LNEYVARQLTTKARPQFIIGYLGLEFSVEGSNLVSKQSEVNEYIRVYD
jgi:hypothetical protein